jgi:hypothetical protein
MGACEVTRSPAPLFDDPSAGFSCQGTTNIIRISDYSVLATTLDEPDTGLDLGRHATFGEMSALLQVGLGLPHCHPIDPQLVRLSEIEGYFFNRGADHQKLRTDGIGQ